MTTTIDTYQTDAWCYLNLDNPVCAWAAYRGTFVEAPADPGFVSVWMATMLFANQPERLAREFGLEAVRAARYPKTVSRLRGMYVFIDQRSAELAASWGGPFSPANLTDLSLAEARLAGIRHDANWISFPTADDWMDQYWAGTAHPNFEPVWETLAQGRLTLLGTELRNRAFARIEEEFPESLLTLETARLACWIGSDLGNVAGFVTHTGQEVSLQYLLDWREADDPAFQKKIVELRNSGHPINNAVLPLIAKGDFILPDFRPLGFVRPIAEMPYLAAP